MVKMSEKNSPVLFLIPTPLGDNSTQSIPAYVAEIITGLDCFIVEHAKTARHHLKAMAPTIVLPSLTMFELNEHDKQSALEGFQECIRKGKSVGLLSDAGCPGVADPGAAVVALAHKIGVRVRPLVGPSSILLALMASGMNGQSFAFHGYLDAKKTGLSTDLRRLETQAKKYAQTQVFIETPYRNRNVFQEALLHLQGTTKMGIAMDLTTETEYIAVKTVAEWKKEAVPALHKRPAVFTIF